MIVPASLRGPLRIHAAAPSTNIQPARPPKVSLFQEETFTSQRLSNGPFKTTQDHDTIRNWAEQRGARSAEVSGTHKGNEPGILRFCFPKPKNHNDSNLKEISWDEFFQKFDENNLELIYQEKTADGEESNFSKLVHPSEKEHSSRKSSTHSGSSHKSRAA